MIIAIIGAGKVGAVLGKRWADAGHEVVFGVRDAAHPHVQAAVAAAGERARATTVAEAAQLAPVIVLATPWPATQGVIETMGDLTGKIVVDCTNPLLPGFAGLSLGTNTSAGEQVAQWATRARVVKTLNTTGSANMADPAYATSPLTMFLCGDDAEAKALVAGLVRDLGFAPEDCGDLTVARYLEPFGMLWIHLAYRQGRGPQFALNLVERS